MLSRLGEFFWWLLVLVSLAFSSCLLAQTQTAPTISGTLADQTVGVGTTTVQFSVFAAGFQPFTYQWYRNSTPLTTSDRFKGTTGSILQISQVQLTDDALYSCTVTNSFGSATSNAAHLIVKELRVVTPPADQSVLQGATATFSLVVSATDPVSYKWMKGLDPIPGATSATLTISNAKATDEAYYSVEVRSSFTATTAGARLTVLSAPTIVAQSPPNYPVVAGSNQYLYVIADGTPPLSIQWYKNGSAIAGVTGGGPQFPSVKTEDTGTYRAVISNSYGTVTGEISMKVWDVQLSGAQTKVYDGKPLSVSVAATVPAGLPYTLSYSLRNGAPISGPPVAAGPYFAVITIPSNPTGYWGVKYMPLTITPIVYSVQFTNLQQTYDGKPHQVSYTTEPAALPLNIEYGRTNGPPPIDAGTYPFKAYNVDSNYINNIALEGTLVVAKADQAISFSPLPGGVAAGSPITLAATASSGLSPVVYSLTSGNATLAGNIITPADAAPITVRASQAGDKNYNAAFTDLTFAVGKQNQSISFAALPSVPSSAKPISLSASATSGLAVTYSLVSGPATLSGSILTLSGSAGTVTVRASQTGNSAYNAAPPVDRSFPVTLAATPVITTQPASQTATIGSDVTFSVVATGSGPLTYEWLRNGLTVASSNSPTYSIKSVQLATAGTFSVVVSDGTASTTSSSAILTVKPAPLPGQNPPVITRQPTSLTTTVGESPSMFVEVADISQATFQWKKNGVALAGATATSIIFPNVRTSDAGDYSVEIVNGAGSVSSRVATLTVSATPPTGSPVIATHPANFSVNAGETATFSVVATGSAPLSYQWLKDSVRVNGATASTLILANVQPADAGNYTVAVSNPSGSVTSRSATLSLNPVPVLTGAYFGDLDVRQGTWALYVRDDNTGFFVAYLPTSKTGVAQSVVVTKDGSFTANITTAQDGTSGPPRAAMLVTVSGQIGKSGQVSGQINGISFTGSVDISSGTKSSAAGLYTASTLGAASSTTTYAVVGSSGRTTVILVAPTTSDVATGTLDAKGQFTATTASGAQLDATVDGATSVLSGKVSSGGSVGSFAGLSDGVESTSRLINLSVRTLAGAGDQTLTVGFVSAGVGSKPMLVRAVGPTLTQFSVPGALRTPMLRLFGDSGTLLATNSSWDSSSAIANVFRQVGAFELPTASGDSALYNILPAGAATAQVTSQTAQSGIVLLEVYDAETSKASSRLVNLSARTRIGPGSETLTVGFVLSGNAPATLLLRGIGPGLSQFGLVDALTDPQLAVFDASGRMVADNQDWGGNAVLVNAMIKTGAFSLPTDSKDSAVLLTLAPGAYTAEISGQNKTSGISLVEVYEVR